MGKYSTQRAGIELTCVGTDAVPLNAKSVCMSSYNTGIGTLCSIVVIPVVRKKHVNRKTKGGLAVYDVRRVPIQIHTLQRT